MKCLIVGPAFPLRGGIADFNEALCRSLRADGAEASLVSFYLQYPGFLFPGKSQVSGGVAPEGLQIFPLISSINPFSWLKAAAFIRKQKPGVVLIRYWLPFMSPALSTIARRVRKYGIKVIAITDNVIPHEKRPGDQALTRYFINSCDAFIAMSQTVVNDLRKFTSKPVSFVPHPVYDIFGEPVSKSEARRKLELPPEERIILFFGFIRPYKGLDLLLNAMAEETVRFLKIKLIVAGEFYGDEKTYRDMTHNLGISDRVVFHSDFIPKEEVKNFFCAADLIVQPYKSATQSGITQIAYHFGRPMLVTRVGGLAEIVPDGKVGYVTAVDSKEIAERICDFYKSSREAEFSRNASKEKGRFTWKAFTAEILNLFHRVKD